MTTEQFVTGAFEKLKAENESLTRTVEELSRMIAKDEEDKKELVEKLRLMTSLVKTKYGNLDKDIWSEIEKSETIITKHTKK